MFLRFYLINSGHAERNSEVIINEFINVSLVFQMILKVASNRNARVILTNLHSWTLILRITKENYNVKVIYQIAISLV